MAEQDKIKLLPEAAEIKKKVDEIKDTPFDQVAPAMIYEKASHILAYCQNLGIKLAYLERKYKLPMKSLLESGKSKAFAEGIIEMSEDYAIYKSHKVIYDIGLEEVLFLKRFLSRLQEEEENANKV